MKNLGLMVILLFCVSAMACGQANNGTFTLTGIPSRFNGKYVALNGDVPAGDLTGALTVNARTGDVTLPRISNGRVSIPMWLEDDATDSFKRYSGNHTADFIEIMICNSADGDDEIAELEFEDVIFRNGSAAKSWSEGEFWD